MITFGFGVFFKLLCLFIKYEFAKLNSCGNSEIYLSNVIILIKKEIMILNIRKITLSQKFLNF
jgi:hypothetical protein